MRWSAADMFQMGQLKNELSKIEQRALRGGPVVLTRHGKPVFALVRLDVLDDVLSGTSDAGRTITKREADFYARIFQRADDDATSGELVDWETIQRRVNEAVARRRTRARGHDRKGVRKVAKR